MRDARPFVNPKVFFLNRCKTGQWHFKSILKEERYFLVNMNQIKSAFEKPETTMKASR